jgi:hypothetical protein
MVWVLVQLAWVLGRWSLAIQCSDIFPLNTCTGTVATLGYVMVRLTYSATTVRGTMGICKIGPRKGTWVIAFWVFVRYEMAD